MINRLKKNFVCEKRKRENKGGSLMYSEVIFEADYENLVFFFTNSATI